MGVQNASANNKKGMIKLKKIIALVLITVFCFSFSACGDKSSDNNHSSESDVTMYQFGDTIITNDGMFEFTPVFEGFAEKLANWPDKDFMTPEGNVSGKTPYEASENKIMMYFSGTINYVGTSKSNETFDYDFTVDYDNGYLFEFVQGEAFNRGKGYASGCGVTSDIQIGEWDYQTHTTFEPLSSNKTRYIRFCIEVPNQLEANTEKVIIKFKIGDQNYNYTIVE